jgi:hypothetical protein
MVLGKQTLDLFDDLLAMQYKKQPSHPKKMMVHAFMKVGGLRSETE